MMLGHRPARPTTGGTESGAVGGVEVLPFGFLVFVVGSLLLANAWAVVDAKLAVTDAAREGARAYVEADATTASAAARQAADDALSARGRDPGRATVIHDVPPFARCARVTVEVTYRVPAVSLPLVGGWGRGSVVRGRASEAIEPYADGLPGEAPCGS